MGLSASQARFLQLTARKSNIEYEAQRINFERLQLSEKAGIASNEYNEKMSNRKLLFSFNSGSGVQSVDITYNNYKNYINQQMEGLSTTNQQMFLVSSSGNKIIVSSEEEISQMIEANPDKGFTRDSFLIAPDLDNVENFQKAIRDGVYFFATYSKNEETKKGEFKTMEWDTLGGGAITDVYDVADDKQAQAEYDAAQNKIQSMDKKLEMRLNELETEREAIQTELESVKKVIDDNVESTFKIFS